MKAASGSTFTALRSVTSCTLETEQALPSKQPSMICHHDGFPLANHLGKHL